MMETWPYFGEDEITAVTEVLRSGKVNYWTGEQGKLCEKEFADYLGVKHAIVLSNGTIALELALEAAGVGSGDEVILSSGTFIATASAVVMRGAKPICAELEFYTQNISARTIEPLINQKTKAIICVHLGGIPCDMDPIMELAQKHGLIVIEDCAQSHGATYKGRKLGSIGHINAFSFCQDKIMTTGGEGGLLTTNDDALWSRAWSFKDHGKNYESVFNKKHAPGFRWLHDSFGTNGRLTEMQSAIARLQLKKLDQWMAKRTENAMILWKAIETCPALILPEISSDVRPAWYKFYTFVRPERLAEGWDRDRILNAILAEGVPCFTGTSREIYKEKAFEKFPDIHKREWPNAARMDKTALTFLVHPTLSKESMEKMAKTIVKVMDEANIEILQDIR